MKILDTTVWARYSSVYFEQGGGQQTLNTLYYQKLDGPMNKEKQRSKIFEGERTALLYVSFIQPLNECTIRLCTHYCVIIENVEQRWLSRYQ